MSETPNELLLSVNAKLSQTPNELLLKGKGKVSRTPIELVLHCSTDRAHMSCKKSQSQSLGS